MSDLSLRIQRLTQELNALRVHLRWTNSQSSAPVEHTSILGDVLDANLVSNLTDVVDQLSQFLWRYIDQAAVSSEGTDFAIQGRQLEQVTEMLRMLRCSCVPSSSPHPVAFVSRVTEVVDQHLEIHRETAVRGPAKRLRLERSA